jgi:hypothetical protein
MNKMTLTISALVLLAIVGLMLWGRSNATAGAQPANHAGAPEGGKPSALTASEALYDFGTISMKNYLVEHKFTISNNTASPIFVPTIYTSCMCTTAYLETPTGEKGPFGMQGMGYVPPSNETIAPGESRQLRVVYDPNAHGPAGVGTIDRFIYVQDDKGGVLSFEVKAVVTP